MEGCENPPLPSSPPSSSSTSPTHPPRHLWNSHFSVTLLLLLPLLLLSIVEECVSLTTSFLSFHPSILRHTSSFKCLFFSVFLLCVLVALAFSVSPCVYISVLFVRTDEAVLATAVCFHYFQLRLEILIHGRALRGPKNSSNHEKHN